MSLRLPPHARAERGAAQNKRWLALDVFRGLAVLSMIQGHTFTALLQPGAYASGWAGWHKILHGLTAPMFLLGGGLAYGLVTARPHDKPSPNNPNTHATRLLRRAVMLLVLGYALQVPHVPWSRIFAEPKLLALTLRVGPLQLVGMCLLLSEVLRLVLRSRARVIRGTALLTVFVVGVAPWVWSARWSAVAPLALGTWFDGYAGSLFPFFPWASFFFVGTLFSAWVLRRPRWLTLMLIGGGLTSAGFAYAMYIHGYVLRNVYGESYELWHTSPLYVLFRAGLVLGCLGVLNAIEPWLRWLWRKVPTVDEVFGVLSKQSLVAYVTHLLVLYGSPFTKGLARVGTTLNLIEVSLVTLGVLLFTTSIAVIWNHGVTQRAFKINRVGKRQWRDASAPKQAIEPRTAPRHGV